MELDATQILDVLKGKDVTVLCHANTLQTACTFLRQGLLMARGVVEDRGLAQTRQKSDGSDKKHGIWYDIFVDAFDIHEKLHRINAYGPVLFVLDVDLLSKPEMPPVWVTKLDPLHWDKGAPSERYFAAIEEFRQHYRKHHAENQFMLRHIGGTMRLAPDLKKIVVDDPGILMGEIDIYSQALGALKASARAGG